METSSTSSGFTREEPEDFDGSAAFFLSGTDADGDLVLESPRREERSLERLRRREESRGDFDRLRHREGDFDLCRRRSLSAERDRFFRSCISGDFLSSLSRFPLCFDGGRGSTVGFPLVRSLNDYFYCTFSFP